MEEPAYIFLGYSDRSGSTFLLNELNKIEGVVVCPELDLLVRTLLKRPQAGLSKRFLQNLQRSISLDKKFILWDIPIDSAGCKNRIDLFFKIIKDYSQKIKEPTKFIVFKERSILEYYKELNKYSANAYFVSLIRDPRAVFASQKRTVNLSQNRAMSNNAISTSNAWNRHCKTTQELNRNNVHMLTITYEELIGVPETTIKNLLNSIDNSAYPIFFKAREPQQFFNNLDQKHILVGQPPVTARISAWENDLSDSDISIIEHICNDNMGRYQYNPSNKSRLNPFKYIFLIFLHWINTIYWRGVVLFRKIRFMGFTKSQ